MFVFFFWGGDTIYDLNFEFRAQFLFLFLTGGIGSGNNSRSNRAATGRRESLVDMAFGNLPWIRRQSSTTSGPSSSSAAAHSTSIDGDKLRKRRESMTAAFPKRSVTLFFKFDWHVSNSKGKWKIKSNVNNDGIWTFLPDFIERVCPPPYMLPRK